MNTIESNISVTMDERGRNEVPAVISQSSSSIHSPSHRDTLTSQSRTRNEHTSWLRHRQSHIIQTSKIHILLLIFLTCCLSLTSASVYIEESMVEVDVQAQQAQPDRLAQKGRILVDPRPPPIPNPKAWTLATELDDLQRRELDDLSLSPSRVEIRNEHSSSSSSSMITTASPSSSTKAAGSKGSATSSSLLTAATQAASPLPAPFDQGFSGNITDSCSNFMYGFLTNSTFKACLPFSLLLQNSNSFFQASKSILRITQTLDATCSANIQTCAPLMSSLATNLTAASNCASDLSAENPLIVQAHLGLLAYKPLYTASCLRNPTTSSYCFADAVTNASSPTDSYIYYLPLNISLPGGSQPTCDSCLKDTMAVFDSATADRGSSLAGDYVGAAQQINVQCGPGFVNQSLAPASQNFGSSIYSAPDVGNLGVLALAVLVGSWLL